MFKKLLKYVGVVVLVLALGVAGLVTYVTQALPNVGPAPDLKVEATPERIARGKYLAHHVAVCIDCHSERDWTKFAGPLKPGSFGKGGEAFDQQFGFPGAFYARNITPAGIGGWTDGELYRAITTGVTREGKPLFGIMPYEQYGRMDPEDIKSIIAYIRTLPRVEHEVKPSKADFPVNIILHLMPKKAEPQTKPAPTDTLAYGKYLTNASGCIVCHTKQDKGKVVGPEYAGGFEFPLGNGAVVRSMNITPHATGIASMTREQFVARFKLYADTATLPAVDMNRGELQTVMPWAMYAGMTEQDLGAIYDYLRTVPAVESRVERWTAGDGK